MRDTRKRWRKLRATWRDTHLLFREFRWPLLGFTGIIIGAGFIYYGLSVSANEPVGSVIEAIYQVLLLTFLQPMAGFPKAWYLEIFYFALPIIGIGILAQGVADFGVLFFNRRARSKEWEMAVASTFNNHIVLVGLGHLGYRVARNLVKMDQDVVAIELNPSKDLVSSVQKMGIPVIQDDASHDSTLDSAGIKQARSLILCTQQDSLNLQVAVKSRRINPNIQIVIRIFDDDFAQALQEQFGFSALSATGMAAPAFAAAAAGVDITRPITIEGKSLSLAKLKLSANNNLVGMSISQVEHDYSVSVVLLKHQGEPDLHPAPNRTILHGDTLAILGGQEELNTLIYENSVVKSS